MITARCLCYLMAQMKIMADKKIKRTESMDDHQTLQLVIFQIGQDEFGVNILSIHEVKRLVEIIRVPKTPAYVLGVINLRGQIVPIVDLRERFRFKSKETDNFSRIIITEVKNEIIGFLVNSVSEILRTSSKYIEPPPPFMAAMKGNYISGVVKIDDRLIMLLDLNKVFSKEELYYNPPARPQLVAVGN